MFDINDIMLHKGASLGEYNEKYIIVKSNSTQSSSGFMYTTTLIPGADYILHVDAILLSGDRCFVYCEKVGKGEIIPRKYVIRKNACVFNIHLKGCGLIRCGILFWSKNKEYCLRVDMFDIDRVESDKIGLKTKLPEKSMLPKPSLPIKEDKPIPKKIVIPPEKPKNKEFKFEHTIIKIDANNVSPKNNGSVLDKELLIKKIISDTHIQPEQVYDFKPVKRDRSQSIQASKSSTTKIIVVIYTFERYYMLSNLLYMLNNNDLSRIDMRVFVYDDCSRSYGRNLPRFNLDLKYHRFNKNHGKLQWFRMIDHIYKDLKKERFDYVIFIPDDCVIKKNFVKESIRLYRSIDDEKLVTLTLNNDRDKCWTNFEIQHHNDEILHTQWVEMAFICNHNFFKAMDYGLDGFIRPPKIKSSGVPCFISTKLHKLQYHMYLVKNSLIYIGDDNDSKLNQDFNDNRLSSRNFYQTD